MLKILLGELEITGNINPKGKDSKLSNIESSLKKMSTKTLNIEFAQEMDKCDLVLLFISNTVLFDHRFLQVFDHIFINSNTVRRASVYDGKLEIPNPKPILFAGMEELEDLIQNATQIDKRISFIDSSIWHQYVSIKNDYSNLKRFLERIEHSKYKYDLSSCKEYLEFQLRLLLNDFIIKDYNNHFEIIQPFSFHSESQLLAFSKLKCSYLNKFPSIHWRIFFIGDSSSELQCIESLLHDLLNDHIHIISVDPFKGSYIDGAINELETNQYDILIVDHIISSSINKVEYGYTFLEKLRNPTNNKLLMHKGPLGKFWVFPISSIYTTIQENLRAVGIDQSNEIWYIGSGGDPLNSPCHFCNTFLSMLKRQIEMVYFEENEIIQFLNIHFNPPEMKEENEIPYWASGLLGLLLYRFGAHGILYNDSQSTQSSSNKGQIAKESFTNSMLNYLEKDPNGTILYGHTRDLLYKLSFGTSAEWALMFEEIDYLEHFLKTYHEDQISFTLKKGLVRIREHVLEMRRSRRL